MATPFQKTFTAPIAIIKVGGIAIGKMKTLNLTENINRGTVYGIGEMTPSEVPALRWDGSLNTALYNIDFARAWNKLTDAQILQRNVSTIEDFINTVLLQENGVQIDIMRKVKNTTDATTGIIKTNLALFASVKGAFITRESMDISENQISGRNADFVYTTPVLYPV